MSSPQPDLISRYLGATDEELGIGNEPEIRVYIRNRYYEIIDELKEWLSFTFIPRFNDLGTWSLRISARSLAAKHFDEYSGIVVRVYIDDIIETIFSGSISTEWEETSEYIQMAGNCDNELLLSTARPNPAQNVGPYTQDYYTETTTASTAMINLVSRNIGPLAPSDWKIPYLTMGPNPGIGSFVTVRARFDTLLILLKELASTPLSTGLGFKIVQSDSVQQALVFKIYQPNDKHLDTKFSTELQTASDYTRRFTRPSANYFHVAGGDNFGLSRTVVEGGDTEDITAQGRRIPAFVDKRGVTNLSELTQELAEQIATAVSRNSVQVVAATVPSLRYKINYDLGDYVTAIVRGVEYARLIQDVEFRMDSQNGVLIIPNVADPFAGDDDTLVQHLNTLQNRISNIERNWNVPDNSLITAMFHPYLKTMAGDLKATARPSAQQGWLICDGSAISRATYAVLFANIGTNYGPGDGSTSFNIPDFRGRFPLGADGSHPLGTQGGSLSGSASFGSHTHLYHHTHNSQPHTHGLTSTTHDHGLEAHRHGMTHLHSVTINSTILSGDRQNTSVPVLGFDEPNVSSGVEGHKHNVNIDLTTNTDNFVGWTANGEKTTGGGTFLSTASSPAGTGSTDGATYTGSPDDSTPNNTDGVSVGGTVTIPLNPYTTLNWEIFTGLI